MIDKKIITIIDRIRKERLYLAAKFSKHAITEIVKDKIDFYASFSDDSNFIDDIIAKCISSIEDQYVSEHVRQKELLQNCLEDDCDYPYEETVKMSPRQKVKNWLEYQGIQGFTDDILDVVSAAYDIILEPDLNR